MSIICDTHFLVPYDKEFPVPTDVGVFQLLESNSLCVCMQQEIRANDILTH